MNCVYSYVRVAVEFTGAVQAPWRSRRHPSTVSSLQATSPLPLKRLRLRPIVCQTMHHVAKHFNRHKSSLTFRAHIASGWVGYIDNHNCSIDSSALFGGHVRRSVRHLGCGNPDSNRTTTNNISLHQPEAMIVVIHMSW